MTGVFTALALIRAVVAATYLSGDHLGLAALWALGGLIWCRLAWEAAR